MWQFNFLFSIHFHSSNAHIYIASSSTPPPAQLSSHANAGTEGNGVSKSKYHAALLVSSHLDIQICVGITKLEKIAPNAPGDPCDAHRNGVTDAGHKCGNDEAGKRFDKDCLVPSLDSVEGVGIHWDIQRRIPCGPS